MLMQAEPPEPPNRRLGRTQTDSMPLCGVSWLFPLLLEDVLEISADKKDR
jgi:hypothetical protein